MADGNSIILVDHDTQILKESDWIVEMGPQAGAEGGYVIAQGTTDSVMRDPVSQIGPFLSDEAESRIRHVVDPAAMFEEGSIYLSTGAIHTVKPLEIQIPKSRLTAVCGVSGSGKTTMILESLVSGLQAQLVEKPLPDHVKTLRADGIRHVKLIDATPIGINVRSTVATYAGVHDELRKLYSKTPAAKERKLKAGAFL